jgi:hypothetical protein
MKYLLTDFRIGPRFPNLYVMGIMSPLSRVDLSMRELDHTTLYRTEVNNERSCASTFPFSFTALDE